MCRLTGRYTHTHTRADTHVHRSIERLHDQLSVELLMLLGGRVKVRISRLTSTALDANSVPSLCQFTACNEQLEHRQHFLEFSPYLATSLCIANNYGAGGNSNDASGDLGREKK